MLQELKEYAEREGLSPEPGFKTKTIRWLLVFSDCGVFLGLQDLRGDDRKSRGREFHACPDLTDSELKSVIDGNRRRHFLVDQIDNVARFGDQDDADLATKHGYFLDMLRAGAAAMPVLGIISDALGDAEVRKAIHSQLTESKAKPSEWATFVVVQPGGATQILVERPEWRDWWRSFRSDLSQRLDAKKSPRGKSRKASKGPPLFRCLFTGGLVEPANHFVINGLGGQQTGDRLVSFDKQAFASYGLAGGENAAMSELAAKTYADALNHLIKTRSRRLAGTIVAYWYSHQVEPDDDPIAALLDGIDAPQPESPEETSPAISELARRQAEGQARRMLDAFRTAEPPDLSRFRGLRFFALMLSANAGRVIVRDWTEGTFEKLAQAVKAWFDDLAMPFTGNSQFFAPCFDQALTAGLRPRPSSQKYADWSKPTAAHRAALWRAAMGGPAQPLPRALIGAVVLSHCTALSSHQAIGVNLGGRKDKSYDPWLLLRRLGIMRAHCNRFARTSQLGDYHVTAILDPNHPRAAYHVGRLMAVLEMIQFQAQGELGATIAQTHYASAATRPIMALPRLETIVQHHLPKIDNRELRRAYYDLLTEINLAVGRTVPRTFDLEDQCLFHLGYYHQRAYRPLMEPPHRHRTLNGEMVRSKSEVIVANLLKQLGIDYEYETELYFRGDTIVPAAEKESAGVRYIKPDFTIRNTNDGRPVYLEHLGMMDSFAYRSDWADRDQLYRKLGILPSGESGGPNGVLVSTEEKRGSIDCLELEAALRPFVRA